MWFTNLSTAFANLAVEGCTSKEVYTIMYNHISLTRSEVDEMKKKKKSIAQRGRIFPASIPDDGPNVPIAAVGDTCGLSEPLGFNDLPANPNVPKNAGVLAPIPTIPSGKKENCNTPSKPPLTHTHIRVYCIVLSLDTYMMNLCMQVTTVVALDANLLNWLVQVR
jgi:hypothetical protein